ncbi:hypothetical protein CBS101457_004923 [Exobasidium rhododendri]|nr:hypothetical protein CBS101457_004923 [Exobasidium rhododendri]
MPVTTRQTARLEQQQQQQQQPSFVDAGLSIIKEEEKEDDYNAETRELCTPATKQEGHRFGLVQETYQHSLYHLVVQAILWNQTRGKQAIVILKLLLQLYPDPKSLAAAQESDLVELLKPIGLHHLRAKRLLLLGKTWTLQPPVVSESHKVRYKCEAGKKEFWEIAHLPGVGKYAIDSYRIFHRDQFRGLSASWDDRFSASTSRVTLSRMTSSLDAGDTFEPEWKRVLPLDKELRAFLVWAWRLEGCDWDPLRGRSNMNDHKLQ